MSKEQFYKKTKGPMDNYEDWYSYEAHNGKIVITHTWDHVSPSLKTNNGSKEYTLEDFYKSQEVQQEARDALTNHVQLCFESYASTKAK